MRRSCLRTQGEEGETCGIPHLPKPGRYGAPGDWRGIEQKILAKAALTPVKPAPVWGFDRLVWPMYHCRCLEKPR
jgi:hypothetical protein